MTTRAEANPAEEPELLVVARRWADADRRVKEAEGDLAVAQVRVRNEKVSRDSAHRDLCAVVQGVSLLADESGWPVRCPVCSAVFDSHDSYGDSKEILRAHVREAHPEVHHE